MSVAVVLDPTELAATRTELALNTAPIRVAQDGIDWGDAQIQAYMSEMARGESPVDFRVPNRQIKMTLILAAEEDSSVEEAMVNLQAKVALIQREGGWLRRGTGLYADVVNATLALPDRWRDSRGFETDVVLTLEALPDFYGDEIEVAAVTETTDRELIFVLEDIAGNYPARCRIVVDELSGNDQLGLIGGIRCRHYSDAATAALVYAAQDLDTLDAATVSSGKVQHTDLLASWTPVLGTNIGGSTFLTHTGSYRLWASVESANGTAVQVRFVYDVGDLTLPEENPAVTVPGTSGEYLLDLGEVRLDEVPVGAHRWQGQIQAKGAVGGEDVKISRLWLQPLDEGAWKLTVPSIQLEGLAEYLARDEFNQAAGALAGKTLPVGGTWAGAGDAVDFAVVAGAVAERDEDSDADVNTGRYATASAPSPGSVVVSAAVSFGGPDEEDLYEGVIARYIDTSNWLMATLYDKGRKVLVRKRVAGTVTTLADVSVARVRKDEQATIRLTATSAGVWQVALGVGAEPEVVAGGYDAALATGGALASGKVGIYDANTAGASPTREFDNFLAYSPPGDAVLFANQSAELSTEGVYREDSSGAAYGKLVPIGDLPRIPPSGLEERPVEVFLKFSRGDLGELPDVGTDDIRAQVFYRPSWLFAAEGA